MTRHQAIRLATLLARAGHVPAARALVLMIGPGPIVIEVNETAPKGGASV